LAKSVEGKKRVWMRWLGLVLLAGFVLFVLLPLTWQIYHGLPGNIDYYLHRGKYQSIIVKVKALSLDHNGKANTRIDGALVNVERNQSGTYTVTITTVDWNHAGVYGYVFSDSSLTSHPNANYPDLPSLDNPGDMPFADKRIVGQEGHWWSVYNNLL
jgi:hypothetical protein